MSSSQTSKQNEKKRVNNIIRTKKFNHLYDRKKKKSPDSLIALIKEGIKDLRYAEDPVRIGELKRGKLDGTYGYRVNQSSRILYQVQWNKAECTVILLRVCNHKNVYGTD